MSESLPTEDVLPEALTTREQWLCWRSETRDGKPTKIPIDPTTGAYASTTDPSTWSDFETARDRAATTSDIAGLGFVFTDEDPIVGVDLDDCRIPETGNTREWATNIIDRLDSFTEISPSGTGYHILVEGSLPEGRNRNDDLELYETARFFTVTGDHVDGTPRTVEPRTAELEAVYDDHLREGSDADRSSGVRTPETENDRQSRPTASLPDEELLDRAKQAANGEKFARLWRGSTAGYESHSEADMALCSLLAFWTGGDAGQMDRLFRDSGLMRDKWDERHFADGSTYGEKTIERAIAGTNEFYDPGASDWDTDSASDATGTAPTPDVQAVRKRETARLERIEELEAELQRALDEVDRLQAELDEERERRRELEAELDADRTASEDDSWVPWG
jgi:primase-polymerase (primpol)-like protein